MPDPDLRKVRALLAAAEDVERAIGGLSASLHSWSSEEACRESLHIIQKLPAVLAARAIAYGVRIATGRGIEDWPVEPCEHRFLVFEKRGEQLEPRCAHCGTWFVPEVSDERP